MYSTESSGIIDGSDALGAGLFAVGATMIIIPIIFAIISYVVMAIILGRIFKKAGVKPSIAWIPIYNQWKFLEIGGQKGFWVFIPVANIIFQYIAMYNIGKKLGKEDWFIAIAILFPAIWFILLAVDSSVWNDTNVAAQEQMPTAPTNSNYAEPAISPETPSNPTQPSVPYVAAVPVAPIEPVYATPEAPEMPTYTVPETLAPAEPVYEAPETPAPISVEMPEMPAPNEQQPADTM